MQFMDGSLAVADAVRLCRPRWSRPTHHPSDHIVEALADMVANCTLDAEYITVRASSRPFRLHRCQRRRVPVYSATTSQGLALMFESASTRQGCGSHRHDHL